MSLFCLFDLILYVIGEPERPILNSEDAKSTLFLLNPDLSVFENDCRSRSASF